MGRDGWGLLALVVLGLAWHAGWAWGHAGPPQWDSAATLEVATHLAAGEGAVSDAVWALAWLPPSLRHPADLHWMPLPARVVVPGVALGGWRGAQAVAVLVAALWGPLAWLWARRLGLRDGREWLAGGLAATGLGALPFLGVPDSVGLAGLLGGGALLAAASGRTLACALLCAGFALTRNDGFLLALPCALALPGWRALVPLIGGVGATAAWTLRGWAVAGEGMAALRRRSAHATEVLDLLRLEDPAPLTLLDRAQAALTHLPLAGLLALLAVGVVPGLLAALALTLRRHDRSLWPVVLYPLLLALVVFAAAPGLAEKGTFYRSFAAVLPVVCALAMAGSGDVLRGLPRWLLPGLVAAGGVLLGTIVGGKLSTAFPVADDCAALDAAGAPPDAPVLAYEPLHVTARCGRPALQIPPDAEPAVLGDLADRYGIDWAVAAPEDHPEASWRATAVAVPGFVAAGDRVLRRDGASLPRR